MLGNRLVASTTAAVAAATLCFHMPALALNTTPNGQPTTVPGSRPAALKLTMDQAVSMALKNSKTLRTAAQSVLKAHGQVNQAKTVFVPTVGATATMTHLDEGMSANLSTGTQSMTITLAKQDQKEVDVTAAMPIDITGSIRTAVQATEFQEIATRLEYNSKRNQLVADVKTDYYNVLRAKAFVTVAEQALKNAKDRLATSEAYLSAGTGTRFDVLRSQAEVANQEQNLIAARNKVNLATAALNNALSIDQNTPTEVTDVVANTNAAAPTFDQSVEEAYRTRPEIMQTDAVIAAANKGVRLAINSLLPTLAIQWTYSYTPDAGGFSPKTTAWAAVAAIKIPVFDGGLAKAKTEEAKADLQSAKIAKQQALDGVALEVRQTFLSLVEATERLKVTSASLAQAEEQYRLAQVRYQAGVTQTPGGSPLLEISDAQTALTQAQTNNINAQFDMQNAQATLEKAMGRYAFDSSAAPGYTSPNTGGKK